METRQRGVTCRMSCMSISGEGCFPRGSRPTAALLTDLGKVMLVSHMRQVRYGTDLYRMETRYVQTHNSTFGPRRGDNRHDGRNKIGSKYHFRLVQGVCPPYWTSFMQAVRFCRCIVKMGALNWPSMIPRGWQLPAFERTEEKICGLNLRHFSSFETRLLLSSTILLISTWHLHSFGDRFDSQPQTPAAVPPPRFLPCVSKMTNRDVKRRSSDQERKNALFSLVHGAERSP